jgi:ribosomal protein S27AE
MQVIRNRADERPWWIGRQAVCNKCGSVFLLDEKDEVVITLDPLQGVYEYASLKCPSCPKGLVMAREETPIIHLIKIGPKTQLPSQNPNETTEDKPEQ